MTTTDFLALSPWIAVAVAALGTLGALSVRRDHTVAVVSCAGGLAVSGALLGWASAVAPREVTPLLVVDRFALFYAGLALGAAIAVALLAYGYLESVAEDREEFYVFLELATLGAMTLGASRHFASFFLGLEILTIGLYALIAYLREDPPSIEAGFKYLVLAGASSAFLLFGMALLYAETGALGFAALGSRLGAAAGPVALAGIGLLITGIGFKLALVPFHMWTPDVYEGAPAPVTAFVATISKGAVLAVLLRFSSAIAGPARTPFFTVFAAIAVASMLAGNLLALRQQNVKRLLAYSSIAHLGYLIVALLTAGALAAQAVSVYLAAYFVTTLGAFGVVTVLSRRGREAADLDAYRGLFWRRPWLAALFAAMLLSLAGMPLTAGFLAKVTVVAAGVGAGRWGLVLVLAAGSAIGLFYYLRVVVTLFAEAPERLAEVAVPRAAGFVLVALALLLVWLGVFPDPIFRLVEAMPL